MNRRFLDQRKRIGRSIDPLNSESGRRRGKTADDVLLPLQPRFVVPRIFSRGSKAGVCVLSPPSVEAARSKRLAAETAAAAVPPEGAAHSSKLLQRPGSPPAVRKSHRNLLVYPEPHRSG